MMGCHRVFSRLISEQGMGASNPKKVPPSPSTCRRSAGVRAPRAVRLSLRLPPSGQTGRGASDHIFAQWGDLGGG